MENFRINIKYLFATTFFLVSCANFSAYFNTFYNAKEQFKQAEVIRKKSEKNKLPKGALDLYQSSIEKSKYILSEYPEVDFRKEAYLLIIKSHFFRSEYLETNQAISEMLLEFENCHTNFSWGRNNITLEKMDFIGKASERHGFSAVGLKSNIQTLTV